MIAAWNVVVSQEKAWLVRNSSRLLLLQVAGEGNTEGLRLERKNTEPHANEFLLMYCLIIGFVGNWLMGMK